MKWTALRMISLAGAVGLAGAASADDAAASRYSFPAPMSISDARAFQKIIADPRISLLDSHQTSSLTDPRYTAWRALGLAGLNGFSQLTDQRLAVSDSSDPSLIEVEGLAEFKARVIDQLIATLDAQSILTSDELSMPLDVAQVNVAAVVDQILNTDSAEWGDDVASADQPADSDAPTDTTDSIDTKVLADIASGNGPTQFGFSSGGQAYTAGHLANLVTLTNSAHNLAFGNSFADFTGATQNSFPSKRFHRAHPSAAQPVAFKPSAGQPGASPAAAVPLPPGAWGAAVALLGATAVSACRRASTIPRPA